MKMQDYFNLANDLFYKNQYEEALNNYLKGIRSVYVNVKNIWLIRDAYIKAGQCCWRLKDFELGEKFTKEAQKIDFENQYVKHNLNLFLSMRKLRFVVIVTNENSDNLEFINRLCDFGHEVYLVTNKDSNIFLNKVKTIFRYINFDDINKLLCDKNIDLVYGDDLNILNQVNNKDVPISVINNSLSIEDINKNVIDMIIDRYNNR